MWGDQGRETAAATLGVCGGRVGGGSEVVHTMEGGSSMEVHSVRCSVVRSLRQLLLPAGLL